PPVKSLLILSTANRNALLPTTVSRCQTVALRDTARKFDFGDAPELFAVLESLCLPASPDIAEAEAGAEALIAIFGRIKENAAAAVEARYAGRLEALKAMDDTALTKRLMEQIADDSAGEYRLMRGRYIEAIQAYCGELYMMSRGVPAADLPFPGIVGQVAGMTVPPECGDRMLREADILAKAMRTSAMDELILRAFAFAVVIG
ncbi:MAG: hypothetical protein MJ025_05830, partial [Victivallaceae bacterium]|nr:hypothetical protein [Victivallaceae bacterium]